MNTRYYHSLVKDRPRRQQINSIHNEAGVVCDSHETISAATVDFYTQLFTRQPTKDSANFLQCFLDIVTEADNVFHINMPTEEEVKHVVWDLDPHSAAGPDGYNGCFFRFCWDVIGWIIQGSSGIFPGIFTPKIRGPYYACCSPERIKSTDI